MDKLQTLEKLNVRPFADVNELRASLRYDDANHPKSKYPRGGTEELLLLERKISNLFDLKYDAVVVFAYGMSGVVASLEHASPTRGTTIIHGLNEYSNNKKYIGNTLAKRGVNAVEAVSYSIDYLNDLITKTKPNIIFLETVANGQDILVLDLDRFFNIPELKKLNPLIILDNTLAAGLISPHELLRDGFNVIGVESGLKFYSKHRGSFGFIYTKDSKVALSLKEYRKQVGTAPDVYQTRLISERVVGRFELFQRNEKIFKNAKILAELCSEAETNTSPFSISYPNLKTHSNFELASEKFPNGAAPLFFIKAKGDKNQFDIAEVLLKNSVVKDACVLIESFGYDFTAIWPNSDLNFVRISAGTEDENKVRELGHALRDSLRSLS